MSDPNLAPPPPASAGRNFLGLVIMAAWIAAHVVLFYAFAVSGILAEMFVGFVKSILVSDRSFFGTTTHQWWAWDGALKWGVTVAGAAGVPLGLSRFWNLQRQKLMSTFWLLWITGGALELYALTIFLSRALMGAE